MTPHHLANTRSAIAAAVLALTLWPLGAPELAVAQPASNISNSPNTSTLPNLGDGSEMSLGDERRMGDRIAAQIYRDTDYIDDPVIQDYLETIWKRLKKAARENGELTPEMEEAYAWQILASRERVVNAFALPGAYMGMYFGLVAMVSTRDELASVMAHETTHILQRHISRMMSRQGQQAPWLMGAMILGLLAASSNPQAATAVIAGGQAAAIQSQLNFSRDMEREADRIGYAIHTQAGYVPQGFVSMFARLQEASRLTDSGNFPYLRTHPLNTERIADMQTRVGVTSLGLPIEQAILEFEPVMISARAKVLSNSAVDDLRAWSPQVQSRTFANQLLPQQAALLYGAALAEMKLREFAQAQGFAEKLSKLVAGDESAVRQARLLQAEIWLAQGKFHEVWNLRQESSAPLARAELFAFSQAANGIGRQDWATDRLQTWLADHPKDASAWTLLSIAYGAQKRTLAAVRAQAEASASQFDYEGAQARLKSAQGMIQESQKTGAKLDFVEASIIDTRLRQVQALLREHALER